MTILTDAGFYAPLNGTLILNKGNGNPAFNRATNGTVFDNEGKLITLPSNAARFGGYRSVFNRIGSSSVLFTQNITTTADVYTLSFKGTGTVTLSGTYSGNLIGTGSANVVQTTFTATAGTLTLTPTGTVTESQLELVTGQADQTASDWINTSVYKWDLIGTSALDLSNAPWTYLNGAVTANFAANPIDGLVNAGKFIPTITNGQHYVTQTLAYNHTNGTVTVVYAKLISNIDKVSLHVTGGTNNFAHFNLTGVSTSRNSSVISSTITSLGNNWFKLEAVWNSSVSGSGLRIYGSSGVSGADVTTEDGTSGVVLYLPSSGPADCIKHYTTNKDGSAIPESSLLGAQLNAASRTNNLLYCRDLTNAAWVKANLTAGLTQIGIDGKANTCSLLVANAVDATVLQVITAAATAACSSFYVKRSAGAGSVYFTRDGGTSWTDITSLINSSTFARIKIENTSVTNPQVGFKIATSGDAIIVDYGQNEAGTECSMPILTTTAAATRNADVLTYQTSGNFSDTAGTILATVRRENWANNNGSVVGSSTRGLYTSNANSGVQALDGTNTVNGPSGSISGQRKIGLKYSGASLKAFSDTQYGSTGSYDGSFNLSSIGIMTGTNGYIKDVAIFQSELSDLDLMSLIGIVDKYISKKSNRQVAITLNGSGQATISIQELASAIQTLDTANLKLTISDIYYRIASTANIVRGSNVILNLVAGYDTVNFSQNFGFVLDRNANANVVVNLGSGDNTMIIQFTKGEGYNEPDRQAYKPYER